ncbi:hypothetical protein N9E25_11460 [Verrucomicrobiales bacterium]|nr:hypothetical protein [Verrucomicrobiales bacterium]
MSSNPMKTEGANTVARRIAVIPIVSTSPVAVVASEMEGWSHLSHENDSCDQDKE